MRKKGVQEVRVRCFMADHIYVITSLVSTGIRFTTLPDATPPSGAFSTPFMSPSAPRALSLQPPTTITALFNPMLGHMSSAYTARVSEDFSLSSRFDFNVYSFESEWTMGAEWWLRRQPTPSSNEVVGLPPSAPSIHSTDVRGVVKARASTNNVSFSNTSSTDCLIHSFLTACFSDVGRPFAEHAGQSWRSIGLFKQIKTNKISRS